MKQFCLLFILSVSIRVFSQTDSSLYITQYDVTYADDTGRDYRYTKTEYFRSEHFFVIALEKDHNVRVAANLSAPKQFIHRIKVDSGSAVSETIDFKDGSIMVTHPDSVRWIDWAAVDSFYTHNDSIHVDSIFVRKRKYFHPEFTNVINKASNCGYVYDLKHGQETIYYSPHELAGAVVTSNNFGLRCRGKWKYGKRVGKWKYYTPDGELQRTEKWRNGELKRTRLFH